MSIENSYPIHLALEYKYYNLTKILVKYTRDQYNNSKYSYLSSITNSINKKNMIFAIGLYWDREVKIFNWLMALEYCADRGLRLPTKDELLGFKSGNKDLFEQSGRYWSSFNVVEIREMEAFNFAWEVDFTEKNGNGKLNSRKKDQQNFVRCVADL